MIYIQLSDQASLNDAISILKGEMEETVLNAEYLGY